MRQVDLPENAPWHCQRCGERLNPKRVEWMELDSHTGRYHINGFDTDDPDRSQGWFPFGIACAKTQVKEEEMRAA